MSSKPLFSILRDLKIRRWFKRFGLLKGLSIYCQINTARLRKSGKSTISCHPDIQIILRNGSSDIDVFEQHFLRREILDIDFKTQSPKTILDLGANIGISISVFRMLFPDAEIIAMELDKENASLCQQNHAKDSKVKVLNAAIWSTDGLVGLKDIGDGEWAFQVDQAIQDSATSVPAYTYETLLKNNNLDVVDIVKMDIEGAEAEVLEASAEAIFSRTKVLIIEVHDWIDGIESRVNTVIEACKVQFPLEMNYNGEFLIVTNTDLLKLE